MKILAYTLGAILVIAIIVVIVLNTKPFGKLPSGERLERIKLSENYKDGKFQNQVETTMMTSDDGFIVSAVKGLYGMIVPNDEENTIPDFELPTQKTDLKSLTEDENVIVWFGHSSIFIQLDGKKILVDPVFGSYGTPFPLNNAFPGTKIYTPDDMPDIDVLIITHDHWDHLDYASVKAIKDKVKKVITPLGVASHLEYWGYDKDIIEEKDWYEDVNLDNMTVHVLPARHFSGRGLSQNKTQWASFLLETDKLKIYLSGDSGEGPHFKEIGEKYGEIDFALMESGQYNKDWASIHSLPNDIIKSTQELKAKNLIPIHFSKFKLSNHAWNDPLIQLDKLVKDTNIQLLTPMIGEKIYLDKENNFSRWWEEQK